MMELIGIGQLYAITKSMKNLRGILSTPTLAVMSLLKSDFQDYPPPPAGSTYVRTFFLKNSWSTKQGTGDILGIVQSVGVPYAPFVQGDSQAFMQILEALRQGGWRQNGS